MKFLLVAMIVLTSFTLTACNTIQGVGEDIQQGGQKLEQAVEG